MFLHVVCFLIGEYCCCCCCCRLVAFVCRGLTVDNRLTLQRYSASHGVVNDFSVCCTNLRGLCANHRFCGGQSRRLVQGRACTSYLCPLRANRIFFPKKAAAWYPQEQSVCCSKKSAGTDVCRRGGFRPYPLSSLLCFAVIRQHQRCLLVLGP